LIEPVPVRLIDERLSTRAASAVLAARGLDSRAQRPLVDQTAAAIILQSWLDRLAHLRQESR
jgi:putative Holliday junction resolvase